MIQGFSAAFEGKQNFLSVILLLIKARPIIKISYRLANFGNGIRDRNSLGWVVSQFESANCAISSSDHT